MDYLQRALSEFNIGKHQWYGFRKTDDNGDTIPNDQRMKYEHLILNDDTATMPSIFIEKNFDAPFGNLAIGVSYIPFEADIEQGTCVLTGKPSARKVLFAKAY